MLDAFERIVANGSKRSSDRPLRSSAGALVESVPAAAVAFPPTATPDRA